MIIPRRMCRLAPQQGKRWLISLGLGGLLLAGLLWEARQGHSMRAKEIPLPVDSDRYQTQDEFNESLQSKSVPTLRNPDRWEGHEANQVLRLVRQCLSGGEFTQQCLNKSLPGWRSHPRSLTSFLEALRYHERQVGHEGDGQAFLEQLQRIIGEGRDQTESYQLWFALHRHRWDPMNHRSTKSVQRLQPRYLGLLLQADQTARQGLRSTSWALYEASTASFLDSMLDKMQRNESISMEAFNQTHDLKDLARLYLQIGWWAEAESILYRLAEQEPSDQSVLSLLDQLRQRQPRNQAG